MIWLAAIVAAHADDGVITVVAAEDEGPPGEVRLDDEAVRAFPGRSPADLLRALPGVHLASHGGHGKAPQIFVRGFDAVHGSDLAVSVEGIPLNEPSNIHGHGYLDLWMLPEDLISGVMISGGAAHPERGDFAVAAAADYALGVAEPGAWARLGAGTDRSGAIALGWRPEKSQPGTFLLADADAGLGAGQGRSWRQGHLAAGVEAKHGDWSGRLFALGHANGFDSPGVIREDDLARGDVRFYGGYPVVGGGASQRLLLGARVRRTGDWDALDLTAWTQARRLTLDQDFTGFYDDPVNGDGTRQHHQARSAGARAVWRRALETVGGSSSVELGADVRLDDISQGDDAVRPDGTVWEQRYAADALHAMAGGWVTGRLRLGSLLAVQPGLRLDAMRLATKRAVTDGVATDHQDRIVAIGALASPSAAVVVHPTDTLTLRGAWGQGFRSPEARGLDESGRAPIARANTAELGARADLSPVVIDVSTFATFVADELVFDHTAARYLASGTTRRAGGELAVGVDLRGGLRSVFEVSVADGRFVATGDPIPYAPRGILAAGLFADGRDVGPVSVSGGFRAWWLAPRPLPNGFVAPMTLAADLTLALSSGPNTVRIEVDNPIGLRWRDGVFAYPSWFDTSGPRSELPVRHFTAGAPPAIRVAIERRL